MFGRTDLVLCFAFIVGVFYIWMKYHYTYWKRKGIPFIPATSVCGNLTEVALFRTCPAEQFAKMYHHENAKNEPFVGIHIFHKPALLINDPKLIKQILVKDFNHFPNRFSYPNPHVDQLGGFNLFFLKNPLWKQMRTKLTPIFTSGKLKTMFNLINDIGIKLDEHLQNKSSPELELKEVFALYATDVIATIAFGIDANSLNNPEGEFYKYGRHSFKFTLLRAMEFSSVFFLPQIVSPLRLKVFSAKSTNFMRSTIEYVMEEREKSGVKRNDLIDILLELRNDSRSSTDENNISFEGDVLIAQAAVFFAGGSETTSSVMAYSLYELCINPEIQTRLRNEIRDVLQENTNELSYDSVQSMQYLDMVIKEVLRLYPPLPFLDRECILFEGASGYSMEPFSSLSIPHGMPVYIPIFSIQRDSKYFPDPEKFDPGRFSPENKEKILPFTNMSFGTGPHNCIGERFGMMQAKLGMIHFLKNHFVRPSKNTPPKIKFDPKALFLHSLDGMYSDIVKDTLL